MYNNSVICIISNELIDIGLNNVLFTTIIEVLMYYHYNLYDYIITNYSYIIFIYMICYVIIYIYMIC